MNSPCQCSIRGCNSVGIECPVQVFSCVYVHPKDGELALHGDVLWGLPCYILYDINM